MKSLSSAASYVCLVSFLRGSSGLVVFLFVILFNTSLGMTGVLFTSAPEGQSNQFVLAQTFHFSRGPTVNQVTNESALIFWRTTLPTNSTVEYGLDEVSLGLTSSNSTLQEDHRIRLTGLSINTTYYYRVISNGTTSDTYHFKTAPADGEYFKMILLGDNRPGQLEAPVQPEIFEQIIDLVIAEDPHIVIMGGDFVYDVSSYHEQNLIAWEHFTNISDRIGHFAPVYGVVGNHDTADVSGSNRYRYYLDAFENYGEPSIYYSFDYAGVHFTVLDSEEFGLEGRITGTQYDWLIDDLNSTSSPMKFVFAHRPLYPCRHIGSSLDVNIAERDRLQQLFEDENVTLFGSGHDHLYNRITVNGVVHIISAGAGAPLYPTAWGGDFFHYLRASVEKSSVFLQVIKPDLTIDEEYLIPDTGPIEIELRGFGNNTEKPAGMKPEVYFSRHPVTIYYSWDSNDNTTVLTGLPEPPGEHILDIYAEDDQGVWGHAHFVFSTRGSPQPTTTTPTITTTTETPTTTTTPTEPSYPDGFIMTLMLSAGVAAAIIIVIVFAIKRR